MYRLWLIFSQAATVAVAVLFVVSTFHPEWLPRRVAPVAQVAVVRQAPVTPASAVVQPESLHDAVDRATPSVVNIFTSKEVRTPRHPLLDDPLFRRFFGEQFPDEEQRATSLGSGVIVSPSGYILTNHHVVEAAEEIEVALPSGTKLLAKVVGSDPETDLAVLRVDADGLRAISFGSSDALRVGDVVLAIGNPFGVGQTVTSGIVSALGRSGLQINTYENFIQTDAAINPGNSGGALVNMNGEVIGINTAIASTSGMFQGYGFAIPVNIVKTVAADLIRYGEVRRGYIGVQIKVVDQTLADAIGMKDAKGVFVDGVVKGGAGDQAGLKDGDVILSIDGREMNAPNELQSYIATKHIGDEVAITVYREGKTFEKKVALKARDTKELASADEESAPVEKESGSTLKASFKGLGLTVRNLTKEEKDELGVERGVLVTEVEPYSEAAKRGLQPNMVILDADKKPLSGTAELRKVFERKKEGDSVLLRVRIDKETVSFVAVQLAK